jgi:integrase
MSDRIPTYRRKKIRSDVYAAVTLPDGNGRRRDVLLGKYGTAASKQEYAKVIAEWQANRGTWAGSSTATATLADITIRELVAKFWPHVQSYYRRADGTETQEVSDFRYTLRPLKHLYGDTPAKAFGPIALKTVRDALTCGYDHPKYGRQVALCRGVINQRIKRIRRMFSWAVEQELIPAMILHALQAVKALKRGRTTAREAKPILPVSRALVQDTLPLLRPMLRDMVMLQLETGMRPGEMVSMRACDVDTTGAVWLYTPTQHKTAHHGHGRIVPIGPKAQAIVRRYLVADTQANLFSPRANMAERSLAMRAARTTKVQPSQLDRRKTTPKKRPGDTYSTLSYGRAIAAAIRRHNRKVPEAEQIPHWHPHQLRKLRALELKRAAGLDVARAVLGHKSPTLTEHYATLDVAKGAEIMARIG